MTFSVVIPVYNRTDALRTAIESVFLQTFKDYEIIVVDDGSDISVPACLAPYMGRISYIRHDRNLGVSAARNTGIKHGRGEYVAFLDSDDLWLPHKLERQYQELKKGWMACHTGEFWYRENRFVNQGQKHARYGGDIFSKILDTCRVSPSTFAVHRSVFMKSGFFDEHMRTCEDYDLWLRIAAYFQISYIPEKLSIKRAVLNDQLSRGISHIEFIRLVSLARFLRCRTTTHTKKAAAMAELERKYHIVKSGLERP